MLCFSLLCSTSLLFALFPSCLFFSPLVCSFVLSLFLSLNIFGSVYFAPFISLFALFGPLFPSPSLFHLLLLVIFNVSPFWLLVACVSRGSSADKMWMLFSTPTTGNISPSVTSRLHTMKLSCLAKSIFTVHSTLAREVLYVGIDNKYLLKYGPVHCHDCVCDGRVLLPRTRTGDDGFARHDRRNHRENGCGT